MNTHFSIPPWEHRGSGCSTAPHATASLEVGGREREFLLKMREGILYFKEPTFVPVSAARKRFGRELSIWAVTKRFERELRGDELVEAWKCEVERGNFGRLVVYQRNLLERQANTILAMIHRADGASWVREWFRPDWLEVPALPNGTPPNGKRVDVWGDKFRAATQRAFGYTQRTLLDCALPVEEGRPISPSWQRGNEAELRRVFALVMQFYTRQRSPSTPHPWSFAACNPASNGGFLNSFDPAHHLHLQFSPALEPMIQLLEEQFVWTAMEWRALPPSYRWRLLSPFLPQEIAHKWGYYWRGHFSPSTPQIKITLPPVEELSVHEKLESLLELRDWMHGKISPEQSAHLLAGALD